MFSIDSLRADHFNWSTALSLAEASKLAYERQSILEDVTVKRWGFQRHIALDRGDTQGFIAIADDLVLIAFRGSESVGDWLTNLDVLPLQRPYGWVHRGFLGAYLLVDPEISSLIDQVRTRNPRLWVTGHSLGGALAAIAAAELSSRLKATGIYTYGQPRLGSTGLQSFFSQTFPDRFTRFVNDDDIVTRVPPGYEHVGKLIHFDASGNVEQPQTEAAAGMVEPSPLTEEEYRELQSEIQKVKAELRAHEKISSLESIPNRQKALDATVEGLFPSLSDHSLDRYIAIIRRFADRPASGLDEGLESFRRISRPSVVESVRNPTSKGVGADTQTVPVLVRLRSPSWIAPKGVQIDTRVGNYISANSSLENLRQLELDPNVESIEISRDAGFKELAHSVPFVRGDTVHRPPIAEKGDAALIGIIDSGIDVLHEAFRDDAGRTRILAVWNQLDDSVRTPNAVDPPHFEQAYGTLYLGPEIQQFVSGAVVTPRALRDPGLHGTHVASIAAGRAVGALADGMAPDARLVVVIPKMVTAPGDPRSVGYSKSHFDALAFLKLVAEGGTVVSAAKAPMAINVSLGMNAGAHDGSSLLESSFDAITTKGRTEGIVIVKSAGNERGFGGHARIPAFLGVSVIEWQSDATFRAQDYFELWYDRLDELEFALIDPVGNRTAKISRSNKAVQQALGGNTCNLDLTELHPDNGDNRLRIWISNDTASIQHGRWRLEVEGKAIRSRAAQVDIWIERDDSSRAVRFIPEEPETTLSIPGTAETVITVAACQGAFPLTLLPESSFGLTRTGRAKPDVCAPGQDIVAAMASDANHRAVIAMSGTSMAAPHVTGALALVLSDRHKKVGQPQYNARQLLAAINQTSRPPGMHNRASGHGVIDAEALSNRLK